MAVNALRGKASIARHSARFDDGSTPLNPIRTARRPCVYIEYIHIIWTCSLAHMEAHMDVFHCGNTWCNTYIHIMCGRVITYIYSKPYIQ